MERSTTRYLSADGELTFLVIRQPGDIALGFEGTPWHTHADILAALSGYPPEEAVARYVADLLESRLVIAIATVDGAVRDIWVAEEPDKPDRYKPDNEIINLRYWDGRPYRSTDAAICSAIGK